MAGLGWQELLIILAIVLVVFGGTRLVGLGKASGKAIREFKDELGAGKAEAEEAGAKEVAASDAKPDPDPEADAETKAE